MAWNEPRVSSLTRAQMYSRPNFLALEKLGKCRPGGVSVIRGMLDDPAFADEAPELVKALAEAGGAAVGEELNNRLRQDLAFWTSRGPSLSVGWWNRDTSIHAPLRDRYAQTYQLILALELTRYQPAIRTAADLRDFWRSLPQLNDPSGLDQIASECEKLVFHILKSGRSPVLIAALRVLWPSLT